jgi:hypothetical protein
LFAPVFQLSGDRFNAVSVNGVDLMSGVQATKW